MEVEEVEEEEEENTTANGSGDDGMHVDEQDEKDEDELKEHAELLALPPHGSEVFVGGIPYDASEGDLKNFCQSAGEVSEVLYLLSVYLRNYISF